MAAVALTETQKFIEDEKGFNGQIFRLTKMVRAWDYTDDVKTLPFYDIHIDEAKKRYARLGEFITWADSELNPTP